MKDIIRFSALAAIIIVASSCTDLNETVYDQVMTNNYYNTKSDVIQAVFRPFEHVYCCEYDFYEHEELTADHFITPQAQLDQHRGQLELDVGVERMLHRNRAVQSCP